MKLELTPNHLQFCGIATKLNKSPNLKAKLIELFQENNCKKPHNVEQDVLTRWNSAYLQLNFQHGSMQGRYVSAD
jgi:hypothetical protein